MYVVSFVVSATLKVDRVVGPREQIFEKVAEESVAIRVRIVKLLYSIGSAAHYACIELVPRLVLGRLGIEQVHPNVFGVYRIVKVVDAMETQQVQRRGPLAGIAAYARRWQANGRVRVVDDFVVDEKRIVFD